MLFRYDGKEYVDVHKVASVEGTYVANYRDGSVVKSAISYNKGSFWHGLSTDGNSPTDATSIHLALASAQVADGMPDVLSTPSAAGIVLASVQRPTTLLPYPPRHLPPPCPV